MKTVITKDPSLKEHEFIFKYRDSLDSLEEKEGIIIIQEPTWDLVAEAYKYLSDEDGRMDLIKPGKLIFDLCALDVDYNLTMNNQAMLSVCSQLAIKFVVPINAEIKKK